MRVSKPIFIVSIIVVASLGYSYFFLHDRAARSGMNGNDHPRLMLLDESVRESTEFVDAELSEKVRDIVEEWLADSTLEDIDKRWGPGLRRDTIHGEPEEQMRAQFFLVELAARIADEFPDMRNPEADPLTYSAGWALISAGQQELGLKTLLREGYCLTAPAMILLENLYNYGLEDDVGRMSMEPHDPRILSYWQDMAKIGIPRGQLVLGKILLKKEGDAANKERALRLLESSEMGEAMLILGTHYSERDNRSLAERWWKRAAENANLAEAWHNLGILARDRQNFDQSLIFLNKALETDESYNPSRIDLGRMYIEGWGVDKDPKRAAKLMKTVMRTEKEDAKARAIAEYNFGLAMEMMRAPSEAERAARFRKTARDAKQGNPEAMVELGELHARGLGVERDLTKAVSWWRKAAEAGNPAGMASLGTAYQEGLGMDQNSKEAIHWYQQADAKGNSEAMHRLGYAYSAGEGVDTDGDKAVKWLKKAIAEGHTESLYALGAMYASGHVVTRDYAESVKWYKLAAAEGHTKAMVCLGMRYSQGQGVEQAPAKAAEWFGKAANLAEPFGMFMLGGRYAEGIGVPKDSVQAYIWCSLAIRYGFLDAYQNRDAIAADLSDEQKAQADQQVDRRFEQIHKETSRKILEE